MKGHKLYRKAGGKVESDASGDNDAAEDLKTKPEARTNAKKVDDEATERKAGGRVRRKTGGNVVAKQVGGVVGSAPKANAGRAARKSGGSCDSSPFSSAKAGTSQHKTNKSFQ